MPVSKRTGKRYAAGSQSTYGGWEPRTCITCGEKIVKSKAQGGLRFEFNHVTGQARSCHAVCGWPVRVDVHPAT